ncbi:MAG TPA: acetyl-CoA carboxylase biotin carboxylase subunit [Candidatus Polarisedimenticolaceae bacterium]|nr:acetyl-CoA carboxylase biotin carboxylase subunit [Candidatus Polarisedimenticolaceae bacterium]
MFRSVLIANRGEIASRIVRACRELGIRPVVAYSEADRDAPWLSEADAAVCIGAARSDASYLDATAVLQAAEQTACQAIHPGYGFLAENAVFAARCEQQGIAFVGPRSAAIRRMGSKALAKRTMAAHGVATIPGSATTLSAADAAAVAEQVGYPVLLKAAAGGGGKGMRRCETAAELPRAFEQAALEADKAFGDPSLYLEKQVRGARHVEFQILCDAYGRGIHLGERDCSIQRKHQKLVEEAPSPAVGESERSEIGMRVARVLAAIGYRGAGTVEFLRDPAGRFYFMEMNTRLQVEHPVTEMITGVDLVVEQLCIAANQPMRRTQDEVKLEGHAIEFRINAEDPQADFAPDPGRVDTLSVPSIDRDGVQVRWDSAIRPGYRIPPYYDSMVGKLIVHGPDRPTALAGAEQALAALQIGGVKTTIGFHRRLLTDRRFRAGHYDIDFLARRGAGKR